MQKIRYTIKCLYCGTETKALTRKKKYCSKQYYGKDYFPEWSKDNPARKEYSDSYYMDNQEARQDYYNDKYDTDIDYKLKKILRSRLNKALNGNYKSGSAVDDLGCSIDLFKKYIESKWLDDMSWDNHMFEGWHIDHIIPLAAFDLTDAVQLKKAVHYTNLQPLWAKDNMAKGSQVPMKEKINARSSF